MRFKLFAIAASLLFAIGLGFITNIFTSLSDSSLTLEDVAINHVTNEIDHLSENNNIQLAKLNSILKPFNIQFKMPMGKINYAGTCPIRNSKGVHIILQNKNAIATLLLMPGEYIKRRRSDSKGDFKTTLIPTHNGSIAIVTEKDNPSTFTKQLEKELTQTMLYI